MLVKRVGGLQVLHLQIIRYQSSCILTVSRTLSRTLQTGKASKEKLEDLRANNAQLQEENEHLKEQVHMFNKRIEEM